MHVPWNECGPHVDGATNGSIDVAYCFSHRPHGLRPTGDDVDGDDGVDDVDGVDGEVCRSSLPSTLVSVLSPSLSLSRSVTMDKWHWTGAFACISNNRTAFQTNFYISKKHCTAAAHATTVQWYTFLSSPFLQLCARLISFNEPLRATSVNRLNSFAGTFSLFLISYLFTSIHQAMSCAYACG